MKKYLIIGGIVALLIASGMVWKSCADRKAREDLVNQFHDKIQTTEDNTVKIIKGKTHNVQSWIGCNLWGAE